MHYSSLRSIAKWRNFTYKAVRQRYHTLRRVLKEPERKPKRIIAIDETKLHGEQVYVWMTRDVDTRDSWSKGILYEECLGYEAHTQAGSSIL
jgi:transposase-like protein